MKANKWRVFGDLFMLTRSMVHSTDVPSPPICDPNQIKNSADLLSLISNPSADLTPLAKSDNVFLFMLQMLKEIVKGNQEISNQLTESQDKVHRLEERCTELEVKCSKLEETCADLKVKVSQHHEFNAEQHCRLMYIEQYSRRNTAIITGLEYQKDEDLANKVCKLINDADILPFEFDTEYISHVHRNKIKPNKTPTVTLQLLRAVDTDKIFAKKKLLKAKGINIFNVLSESVKLEQDKIKNMEEVEWVAFFGHSRFFGVKMKNDVFYKGIHSLNHLLAQVGTLTPKPGTITSGPV